MSPSLPEFVDPWRWADLEKTVSGRLSLDRLSRLSEVILGGDPEVEAELRFARDDQRRARVMGSVHAKLRLQCQRCLEPVELMLDVPVRLAVVQGEAEAARLPEDLDSVPAGNGRVRPADIIEDELLLALPLVAMHPAERCPAGDRLEAGEKEGSREPDRGSPFAVLADLKRRDH